LERGHLFGRDLVRDGFSLRYIRMITEDEEKYDGHCPACDSGDWFKKGDEDDCRCPDACHVSAMIDEMKDRRKYGG